MKNCQKNYSTIIKLTKLQLKVFTVSDNILNKKFIKDLDNIILKINSIGDNDLKISLKKIIKIK